MKSTRLRDESRFRRVVRVVGMGGVVAFAAIVLVGCSDTRDRMPNRISYTGPDSVQGPAGAFAFSMVAIKDPVSISISSEGAVTCSLSGSAKVTFSGGSGTCVLTGVSDKTKDVFEYYSSVTLTQRVAVTVPSPAPTPSPSGPPSPAAVATASSAAPVVPAASSAPAPRPSASPTPSRTASASATPSRTASAAAPSATAATSAALSAQTVTWNPSTAISSTTPSSDGGREFTPSTQATSSGDGAITYSIGTPNTSFCHLRADRIVVVGQNGTCTVIATAAATARFAAGSTSVTFTISNYTDPRPAAPAPSSSPPVF